MDTLEDYAAFAALGDVMACYGVRLIPLHTLRFHGGLYRDDCSISGEDMDRRILLEFFEANRKRQNHIIRLRTYRPEFEAE